MKVIQHKSALEFLERAGSWLEAAEAENNLLLGIAASFKSSYDSAEVQRQCLSIEQAGKLVGAALLTPRRLLLSRMPRQASVCIGNILFSQNVSVPGVLGPTACVRAFAENWCAGKGVTARLKMRQRICACTAVTVSSLSVGYLRAATREDEPLLVQWAGEFCRDANIADEAADMRSQVPTIIRNGRLYVWEDGEVVSMADVRRETAQGIAVSLVYTPAALRNRGYASSCVAQLTQLMLDRGKLFCCLFTDLANRTANSIYQKIGYQPICEVEDLIFG